MESVRKDQQNKLMMKTESVETKTITSIKTESVSPLKRKDLRIEDFELIKCIGKEILEK